MNAKVVDERIVFSLEDIFQPVAHVCGDSTMQM